MANDFSDHSVSSGESENDVQTPRSSRTASSLASSPARSTASSVDNVADMIARRHAMEEQDNDDVEEEDVANIYAQMRQRILGKQSSKSSAPTLAPAPELKSARETSPRSSPRTYRKTAPSSQSPQLRRQTPTSTSNSGSDSDVPMVSRKRPRPTQLFETDRGSDSDSDSDVLPEPATGNRLQELIARRRRERLEKEKEKDEQGPSAIDAVQTAPRGSDDTHISDNDLEGPVADHTVEDRMTQQSRPTRKASKKAIEEMNRETQRMNRNMQLTHQAKVKTKFSIADFAARFASRPAQPQQASGPQAHSSSAAPSSDVDVTVGADTPPSSPPSDVASPNLGKSILGTAALPAALGTEDGGAELPSLEEILAQSLRKVDKDKAPATTIEPKLAPEIIDFEKETPGVDNKKQLTPQKYRVTPVMGAQIAQDDDSSDDGLEIVKDRFSVFNEVQPRKAGESRAFQNLRFLANMNNHEVAGRGRHAGPSMTAAQLDVQLRRRAALQARQERDEKIAALRARGVIVQTAEERERDQMEIENLLEKARAEADELRKKEKAQAKADGTELGLEASDDESDDDEWREDVEDDGDDEADVQSNEDEAMDMSGSEDEETEDAEKEVGEVNGFVDDAADETEGESEEDDGEEAEAQSLERTQALAIPGPSRRTSRKKFVIQDDDDEDDEEQSAAIATAQSTQQSDDPGSVDELAAAFGFGAAPMVLMSPSQMFAGTMGASQSQREVDSQTQEQDSMALFNRMVPSGISPQPETPSVALEPTQTQQFEIGTPSSARQDATLTQHTPTFSGLSQYSSIPTPSQDIGFSRFGRDLHREDSIGVQSAVDTIDTVLLSVPESPVQQKRGRLQRRRVIDEESAAHLDDEPEHESKVQQKRTTAFDVMRKATSKPAEPDFNKKKSGAKNMVDEQAEESEDEYAGLGGASDDEDDGEGDEIDRQMIDESDVKVDERKMAAFYAEKARAENEAQTSKLYKDLMSGALRRQRGDAFDLDSDEDEQLAERRRRKQREEARKRRLLLGDEHLGKFDGNEKKEAFLRAIEDRDEAEDDDEDMLDGKDRDAEGTVPNSQPDASQSSQSQAESPTLQQVTGNALKRKPDTPQAYDGPFKRPRRPAPNAAFHKPASIAEVRASVSFLVDEPHAESSPLDDAEPDEQEPAAEERPHFSARRTHAPVVDRLLMRKTSSSLSTASTAEGGVAFVSRSSSTLSSFRAPSLLRRATSGAAAGAAPGLKRDASGSSAGEGVRRQGGKKSSIAYAAREAERRKVVEGVERRRKEDVKRIAGLRRGGGLAGMAGGGFE
ncbi:hypothetical protein K461DRAFT_319485 [Myriangium duriaei CBS 260.36]|uniref:DNA replication checkpoint mediator MRC1 domain-containing protein n=1 Tax=Myriangium duriaei CBS 260.36 TaxID=1168546 RepID=A0A9P4J8D7_9PEZI|nr:hypothetical protein K461DRAFT_319485 [Myriangium duriaei CBS 260.36]